MNTNIEGKVVVITGASSGLGEATARHLAARGAIVVLGARRLERIQALAVELTRSGSKASALATDVTRRDDVQRLIDLAVQEHGRVDVLINNAGVMPLAMLDRLQVTEWEQTIDVNIKGVLYGIAAALPQMQRQRYGHIVNVASVAGFKVTAGGTVYAAAKHAVRAISEGLRLEVKGYGIRTTVISPGAMATELVDGISDPAAEAAMRKSYEGAISPASFARAVAYAIEQPVDVDVNEIVVRPTNQVF